MTHTEVMRILQNKPLLLLEDYEHGAGTFDEWKIYYKLTVDKSDYVDFDSWVYDMLKNDILKLATPNYNVYSFNFRVYIPKDENYKDLYNKICELLKSNGYDSSHYWEDVSWEYELLDLL